jgi:protein-S-isoprenylcysteine O-methyltransferase Ste14
MIDQSMLTKLNMLWIKSGIVLFPVLLFVKQPYGRHMRKGWGPSISNQTGWIVMEIPSLILILYFIIHYRNFSLFVIILSGLWIIHYFNRTLIFPFRIKTKGKQMPLIIIVFGILFNFTNASFNGISLGLFPNDKIFSHFEIFRISIGLVLFVAGMFINIWSDNILIHLRKNSKNGYQIPRNGLFEYISCPNYFGEIIEWAGFAIMAWNLAAASFCIWTIVNLLPRAIDHHKWYLNYFVDYPKNRKAVVPYIL